jgi:putative ABC transport system permease protein
MNDLRFALRHLFKHPSFTLIVALTLGLGIALVTTQYSLIDGLLLRPLPFANGDRLLHIAHQGNSNGQNWRALSVPEFLAVREQQHSFEDLAAFSFDFYNLSQTGGTPRRLSGRAVSANFFELVNTPALFGRGFRAGEDQAGQNLQLVLSHAIWTEEFGADPTVIGRNVSLNGETASVIGVMPAGFGFPYDEDCWVNLRLPAAAQSATDMLDVEVFGRLKPGLSLAQARADLMTILQRRPGAQDVAEAANSAPALVAVQPFPQAYNSEDTVTLLGTMLAMTLFVLALACVNVANLLFIRASDRLGELAVRSALGAGRGRLIRQLLIESGVLAGCGTVVGLLLANVGVHLLQSEIKARVNVSSWTHFDLNHRVLAITALLTVLSGLAAGLLPALRMARLDLNAGLRADGRGSVGGSRAWAGRSIVIGQLGFACAAMVMASLLALSAVRSSRGTLPFDPDTLLIGRVELQGLPYVEPQQRSAFYRQLLDRVGQVPGVAATAVSSRDLVNPGVYSQFELEDRPGERAQDRPGGWLEVVSRDYFQVIDRHASSGRLFSAEDHADSLPVALVNASFAAQWWPGRSPIGERIRRVENDAQWATVIGVVPDLNIEGIGNRSSPGGWYLLQDQQAWGWLDLLVRVHGDPLAMIGPVREAVAAIDPNQPIHSITTLRERTQRGVAGLQIVGTMASIFAATALLLVAVGVYGVASFATRRRTRELGLRRALGASAGSVAALLLRQSLGRSLAGISAGLALGFVLAQPLAPVIPMVSAGDPWIYLGVGGVLTLAALLASWIPARRAAVCDPMESLRTD